MAHYVEYLTPCDYIDDLTVEPFEIDAKGYLKIPKRPGLGVTLDRETIERGQLARSGAEAKLGVSLAITTRSHACPMTSRAATEYRYEKLTWPEINDAVDLGKVCIVPCGAVEQHGPHLPLDVDLVCPGGIATGAGQEIPDKMLVLPIVAYGYTGHVMDFPGTINNDFEHFMHHVLDITKSLAYHGFKKIILLNGHGSNMPNLDLVARRTNLETDAECVLCRLVEPADGRQGRSCRAGGRASSPAAAPTPASWRRRSTCTSTATTSART